MVPLGALKQVKMGKLVNEDMYIEKHDPNWHCYVCGVNMNNPLQLPKGILFCRKTYCENISGIEIEPGTDAWFWISTASNPTFPQ